MGRPLMYILIVLALLVGLSAIALIADRGSEGKVALVSIEGAIFESEEKVEEIKGYGDDDSIEAIVLRVDSPGGAVAPSQEIFNVVRRVGEIKPVVVSMGKMAASGGYYISAPAELIFANPGTLTGSIGVILEIPNVEGLMDKVGLRTEVIKSGRHKDVGSMFRQMQPEERALLQDVIDDVYSQFINDVASARAMDIEDVKRLAEGRIYTGRQARDIGLVDELGGLQDAIKRTAELAGIEGEPTVVKTKEKSSLLEGIQGRLSGALPDAFPYVRLSYIFSP